MIGMDRDQHAAIDAIHGLRQKVAAASLQAAELGAGARLGASLQSTQYFQHWLAQFRTEGELLRARRFHARVADALRRLRDDEREATREVTREAASVLTEAHQSFGYEVHALPVVPDDEGRGPALTSARNQLRDARRALAALTDERRAALLTSLELEEGGQGN